jgi:flagellar motor component MotA
MLISLTVETSGQGSHALESLTAHKITTFRCEYLATMAMGDDDNDDEDGMTTTTTTTATV